MHWQMFHTLLMLALFIYPFVDFFYPLPITHLFIHKNENHGKIVHAHMGGGYKIASKVIKQYM